MAGNYGILGNLKWGSRGLRKAIKIMRKTNNKDNKNNSEDSREISG